MVLLSGALYAQTCAPQNLLPSASISGTLGAASCNLSDGTQYDAYRVVLPVRGRIQIAVTTPAAIFLQDSTGAQIATGTAIQQPIEAGSYTVIVNAAASSGSVPYSLQTSFSAEPGMLCANFPSLGINQTVTGTLGVSGCTAPDGSPYEAYSLATFGSGSLTVSIASTDFRPVVTVRDTGGALLGSGAGTVTVAVDSSSNYEIVVASSDTSGAYQITTSFQAAANETCIVSGAFSASGADNNAITPASCSEIIDDSGDLAFYSYYSVNVSAAGLADIQVTSTDFNPTLYLLDSGGNQVAIDSGGGGAASNSEIRLQLNPGTYTVEVFSNYSSGGNYTLTYGFMPGAPQPCATASLAVPATQNGALAASSCRTTLGISDVYSVNLAASGTLTLDLLTTAFAGQIAIRDTKDNLIVLNQDLEGLGDSHLAATLPAGNYTVAAAATSGAGAYQLTSAFQPAAIPPCTFAQPVSLNGGYIQNLGGGACTGANGYPTDLYTFTLPADATVAAIMTSSELEGNLILTDSSGNTLRSDSNSYATGDPLMVQYLKAGTYMLAARAASSTVGGLYEVNVLDTPGDRPVFCGAKGAISDGSNVFDTLSYTACQYIDQTFADMYQMTLAADGTIDLRLNSNDFDAYLVLQDAKGNVVATDDDSGGGTNARITQSLPAGTYYVYAKPFANYYSVGKYTLSLSVQ